MGAAGRRAPLRIRDAIEIGSPHTERRGANALPSPRPFSCADGVPRPATKQPTSDGILDVDPLPSSSSSPSARNLAEALSTLSRSPSRMILLGDKGPTALRTWLIQRCVCRDVLSRRGAWTIFPWPLVPPSGPGEEEAGPWSGRNASKKARRTGLEFVLPFLRRLSLVCVRMRAVGTLAATGARYGVTHGSGHGRSR